MPRNKHKLSYFTSSFALVFGIVLIWRGMWYILDAIDEMLFGGSRIITVVGGLIVGFLILYLPDKDLSELRKL